MDRNLRNLFEVGGLVTYSMVTRGYQGRTPAPRLFNLGQTGAVRPPQPCNTPVTRLKLSQVRHLLANANKSNLSSPDERFQVWREFVSSETIWLDIWENRFG